MIAISLTFPAGRYHATPWGRHVNEGAVEWPPSPLRLLRSLVAVWKRTLPNVTEAEIKPIFEALAATPPLFVLPPAFTGHTRHYMPILNGKKPTRTKVFDAFVAIDPNEAAVHAIWPDAQLYNAQRDLLTRLLANLTFLGRAESWCEARLLSHDEAAVVLDNGDLIRAAPLDVTSDPASRRDTELVRTLCADPASAFGNDRFTQEREKKQGKTVTTMIRTAAAYDPDWHLAAETLWLHNQKWSDPPGSRWVTYTRPRDCFDIKPWRRTRTCSPVVRAVNSARNTVSPRPFAAFILRPLDKDAGYAAFPATRARCVAAMLRHAACEAAKGDLDDRPGAWRNNDWALQFVAGHGPAGSPKRRTKDDSHPRFSYLPLPSIGHRHADGQIRRVIIAEPFEGSGGDGRSARWAAQRLAGAILQDEDRGPVARLEPVEPDEADFAQVFHHYTARSSREGGATWVSITPVILPGYDDNKPDKRERLLLDCLRHAGIDPAAVASMQSRRSSWYPGVTAPLTSFKRPNYLMHLPAIHVQLKFSQPVSGPVAIGAGRHCGLGVFAVDLLS